MFRTIGADGQPRGPAVPLTTRITESDHLRLVALGDEYALTFWEAGLRQAFYTHGTFGCPP